MLRNAIRATLCLWILAAPAVQADQQATLYQVGPATARTGVRVYCDARWRDMAADDRAAAGGYAPFLDRCLERCPDLRASDTQNYYEGRVRRACDAEWQHTIEGGAADSQTYEDFIGHCARACAAPVVADTGAQAASGAGTGAPATGVIEGRLLAAGVIGGLALATGIGVSNDNTGPFDQPASP